MKATMGLPLLALAALTGCASYTPVFDAKATPAATDAFIYGNFSITTRKGSLGMDGYSTMGFEISCEDGKRYRLRFNADHPLQVLRLDAATCKLSKFIFSDADGTKVAAKPAPPETQSPHAFAAGHAYYLGDFKAQFVIADRQHDWRLVSAKDNYDAAGKDFASQYPQLAALPTDDETLFRY